MHISSGVLLSMQGDYFVPGSYDVIHGCSEDSFLVVEKEFSIDGSVADTVLKGMGATGSDAAGVTWYSNNTGLEG